MPVNSTHADYDENLDVWLRIRDVLGGDQAIKRAGEKYVARLDSQTDAEFRAYVERGFFYNATSRTVSGYIGMIFRRDHALQLPDKSAPLQPALDAFIHDADMMGTTLDRLVATVFMRSRSPSHGCADRRRGERTLLLKTSSRAAARRAFFYCRA